MSNIITSDQSKRVDWYVRRKTPASLTINVTDGVNPVNITGWTFVAEVFQFGGSTAILTPTVAINGPTGQITLSLTDVNLTIPGDDYFWVLRRAAPTADFWLNGSFVVNSQLWDDATTSTVDLTLNLGNQVLNLTVSIQGYDLSALIASITGKMDKSANLSDVANVVTSRNNLGVGFNIGNVSLVSGGVTMSAPLSIWMECSTNTLDAELAWPDPATWPVILNRPYFFHNSHPTNRFGIRAGGSLFVINPGDVAIILCFTTFGGGSFIGTVVPSSAAISAQIAAYLEGIAWKQPARVATTAALQAYTETHPGVWSLTANANGALPAIDGITLIVGDRILVKDETGGNQKSNGIYRVESLGSAGTPWSVTRTSDNDPGTELVNAVVSVNEGTVNADSTWRQTVDSVTLGTTGVNWTNFGTAVVDASTTVKGKAKLYTATGSNVDGSMDQNSISNAITAATPDATPSVKGKAKLYTAGGSNVDGAMDQNSITAADALKLDDLVTPLSPRPTASYTLVITDRSKLVEMNVAGANNLTVPTNASVAFPVGTQILLAQYGAGQTTVVASGGVTIRSDGGKLKLNAQYAPATLLKIGTNEWYLWGDLTT